MDNVQFFLSRANVLIVEDFSSNLIIFKMMLRQKGYNVRNTKNCEEVLGVAWESLPDIIMVDINRGDTDGYQVCQIIKSDDKLMEIPVIFINSDIHTIDREKVFAVGGADYITIPFNYYEVFARMETHLKLQYMKKSLQERTIQLEEITTDLKEFNILLEEEINERTKTEEALKESERQFRHAIEESPVPMMLYAEDGEIIKISRAWTDITGYTITDIPTTLKFSEIAEVLKEKLVGSDEEYSIKTRIGDMRIFNFYSAYIGKLQDGRSLLSKVAIDITERKRLIELREYDRIKTEFFSNISHELRTPINVIFSALQILELKLKDCSCQNLSTDRYKYTKIMKQNCYRLLRLINNLIDITKLDAGYYDINKNNFNIINLIENITLSVADYIQAKGLSLIFDTDVEEKIVACDAEKIERIILNLLSNAVKFTPYGGEILVNIEDCTESICISVKDTGRGIPADKLNSIFERFVQVDKSLTRDHEGSGIGLSLVKCLVELHGGTISVKSKEGYGTEFNIYMPCNLVDEVHDEIACIDSMGESYIGKINIEFSDIYN